MNKRQRKKKEKRDSWMTVFNRRQRRANMRLLRETIADMFAIEEMDKAYDIKDTHKPFDAFEWGSVNIPCDGRFIVGNNFDFAEQKETNK